MSGPQERAGARAARLSTEFDARRETLERRLADGYERIEQAVLAGSDVTEWEEFWVSLLREYEGVCRERELAA